MGELTITVRRGTTSTELGAGPGSTILETALRAGVAMPHSCGQGTCGTCRLTLLEGRVDRPAGEHGPLTEADLAQGAILACQARPFDDIVVLAPDSGPDAPEPHLLRDHGATLARLDPIATDTLRVVIDLDEPMAFHAGQHLELAIPGSSCSRRYSMANPPDDPRRIELHVRRRPGGAATDRWLFTSAAPGDRVDLRGPLGGFTLHRALAEPAIMIAGGTGLAPLSSMLRHALRHDLLPQVVLYHGGRQRSDLYDVDHYRELAATDPRFDYRPVLSEEVWQGRTGLVTDAVLDEHASCRGMTAFICGPPPMVTAAVRALKRRRMAPRLIFREEFTAAG